MFVICTFLPFLGQETEKRILWTEAQLVYLTRNLRQDKSISTGGTHLTQQPVKPDVDLSQILFRKSFFSCIN